MPNNPEIAECNPGSQLPGAGNGSANSFTAGQIATALGRSKTAIVRTLAGIQPAGQSLVKGNLALSWAVTSLPEGLRGALAAEAARRGFGDIEQLLSAPGSCWQCPIPLSQIKDRFLQRAIKLRDALALPLARQHELSARALLELGLSEFKRIFGCDIGPKQWNRLFDRTVTRAGVGADYVRLEIYLPSAASAKPKARRPILMRQQLHGELEDVIANLENKEKPTPNDRVEIFHSAFTHLENLLDGIGQLGERRAIKVSLIDWLYSACPGLSTSAQSLRRTFNRDLIGWREGGRTSKALEDGRRLRSGNFRRADFSKDLQKIRDSAILHDGNESLAYRKLRQAGELSQEFLDHYHFDERRAKSYVPKTVREAITPKVEMCLPLRRGPWEAKMRGPYIPRDWSDTEPGDYFSGDDVTWNHYFRYQDDKGNWRKTRGECLLMTDLRTGYPLDFLLIAGHYNSEHIRALLLKVHDSVGLPHKGLYFEMGVWKARMIPGVTRARSEPMHWRETQLGFEKEGILLDRRHATTPRAKPIEGLLRIVQERMRPIPGFVGFNERIDKREREQELLGRINRGNQEDLMSLRTMEDWSSEIQVVLDEFARDPQNGKMLPGMSPLEAWRAALDKRPLRKLPDEHRYLFATQKQVCRVTQQGILLTIRGHRNLYCGEATGALIGQDVIAFYNVECPELLTLSDLNRQNYWTVKLIQLPAMTASKEQFAEAFHQIKGHTQPAKTIFGNIRHPVVATITRDNEYDEPAKELGRFHNEQTAAHRLEQAAETRKMHRIQIAAANGATIGGPVRNPDRVLKGMEIIKAARERIARKGQAAQDQSQPDPL